MKNTSKLMLNAIACSVGLAVPFTAQAVLEEVIVTAQKRAESAQDVPIAMNALSGDQLKELGVVDSDDITTLYPNLSMKASTSINSGFSIRGVGTGNFHVTAQQAVGTYVDEVSLPSPFTSQLALFDMERVEVLRGPQNTLFGRNTTGGAVNFISRKPDPSEDVNGYVRAKAGNEGQADLELAVGFPLTETLAGRLALQTVNRDGVFHDMVDDEDVGDIERHSGRLQILWRPSDLTDVLFNIHAGYNRSEHGVRKSVGFWEAGSPNIGSSGARGAPDCPLLFSDNVSRFEGLNNCVSAANAIVANPSTSDWSDVNDAANTIADVDFEGAFVKINHDFENMTLTSITSYDKVEVLFQENTSANGFIGFYPGQDAEYEVFSQELRLASTTDGAYRWIAGVYYSDEDDVLATVIRNGADGTPPFTVVPSVSVDQNVEIFSMYGQLEYDLTDTLTLTAGLRYTIDEKQGDSTSRVIAGTADGAPGAPTSPDFFYDLAFLEAVTNAGAGLCPPPVGGLPCILGPIPVEQDLDEWGGKLGLDWRVNDDVLGYVSYSRGFKSGAFDTRALAAFAGNADDPVGPEFLDAYELGVKSTLLDDTLELNAAVFYYEWEDLQTFAVDENGAPAFLNVPETELYGAEVEVKWAPGDGWFFQGGLGFLETEITDSGGLSGVAEGASLGQSPELTFSGLIQKEIELKGGLVRLQTNFNYEDEWNNSLDDSPLVNHESTFFVNARAAYIFGSDEQYEVAVFVDNITEEQACRDLGDNGSLTNSLTCSPNPGMAFYGISGQIGF